MLTVIWSSLIAISVVFSFASGNGEEIVNMLNSAIMSGADLFLMIAPLMCFWSGIMETAERSGITNTIAKALRPIIRLLFPDIKEDSDAVSKISLNMSANILGMGNAATPLGLQAMKRLDSLNPFPETASDAMCMFVIVNTASIQLIPSSVISWRAQFGSASPSDILPAVLITTLAAFLAGTASAKICSRKFS